MGCHWEESMESVPYFKSEAMDKVVLETGIVLVVLVVVMMMKL
jgi:hypothetical protein